MSEPVPMSSSRPGCAAPRRSELWRQTIGRPLNVLAIPSLSLKEIVEAGAQRVSVGGRLLWAAVGAMAGAAERIRDHGDFSSLPEPTQVAEWLSGQA